MPFNVVFYFGWKISILHTKKRQIEYNIVCILQFKAWNTIYFVVSQKSACLTKSMHEISMKIMLRSHKVSHTHNSKKQ